MTVVYLAAKMGEAPQDLRNVVNTCYRALHQDKPPLLVGDLYRELRESVVNCELIVLRILHFEVAARTPHSVGGGWADREK